MSLLRRRADLSPEAFKMHWRDVRGPLAALMPKLQGYRPNHIVDRRLLGVDHQRGAWDIDGISGLCFESEGDMQQAIASSTYAPVRDGSGKVLAETRVTIEQRTVVPFDKPATGWIKRMPFLKRNPHHSPDKCRHELFEIHGDFVKAFPTLLGYRQNLILSREPIRVSRVAPRSCRPMGSSSCGSPLKRHCRLLSRTRPNRAPKPMRTGSLPRSPPSSWRSTKLSYRCVSQNYAEPRLLTLIPSPGLTLTNRIVISPRCPHAAGEGAWLAKREQGMGALL